MKSFEFKLTSDLGWPILFYIRKFCQPLIHVAVSSFAKRDSILVFANSRHFKRLYLDTMHCHFEVQKKGWAKRKPDDYTIRQTF